MTLNGQLKIPEPAGLKTLAGPHVHQDSLLPSLCGQIISLIKPVWLRAPPSPAFPISCPCPCSFTSPGGVSVHSLSPAALLHTQHLCLGPARRTLLPEGSRCGWVMGQELRTHRVPHATSASEMDGDTGGASEESVMLKSEKNPSLLHN